MQDRLAVKIPLKQIFLTTFFSASSPNATHIFHPKNVCFGGKREGFYRQDYLFKGFVFLK